MILGILLGALGALAVGAAWAFLRRLLAAARRPVAPVSASAETPAAAVAPSLALDSRIARDPRWVHQTLVLKVAGREYSFRTLSLYDVWILYPHLRAIKEMALHGRPLSMIEHAKEILSWVCPELARASAETCKGFVEVHANLLLDFYRSQDFGRMETFGESTTKTDDGDEEQTEEEKHGIFVGVCAAAAQYAGMDVGTFVQQRFEFCANQIIAAHKSLTASRKPASSSWAGVLAEVSASMAGANIKIDPEKKPDWMKAMEKPN